LYFKTLKPHELQWVISDHVPATPIFWCTGLGGRTGFSGKQNIGTFLPGDRRQVCAYSKDSAAYLSEEGNGVIRSLF
jgi:hypothetical protein